MGCTSKPEIEDIRNIVTEEWKSSCSIVEPFDFKKTNGIDKGNGHYEMAFSYKLKVVKDLPVANPYDQRSLPENAVDEAELKSYEQLAPVPQPSLDSPEHVKTAYADFQQKIAKREEIRKRITERNVKHWNEQKKAEAFYFDQKNCWGPNAMLLGVITKQSTGTPFAMKKGDVFEYSNSALMIKSEKGWIVKEWF